MSKEKSSQCECLTLINKRGTNKTFTSITIDNEQYAVCYSHGKTKLRVILKKTIKPVTEHKEEFEKPFRRTLFYYG